MYGQLGTPTEGFESETVLQRARGQSEFTLVVAVVERIGSGSGASGGGTAAACSQGLVETMAAEPREHPLDSKHLGARAPVAPYCPHDIISLASLLSDIFFKSLFHNTPSLY